jgi:hypothetical protein
MQLAREEYIEQAYLFRALGERLADGIPVQDLLQQIQHELLATAKLPMAISFLATELKHHGIMADGMRRLGHYFSSWQAFLMEESEADRGRFDFGMALKILEAEATYRSEHDNRQGIFFFQFESISRNRLSYDRGLKAMSEDPIYDKPWSEWILILRRQLGLVDLSDLIFGRSQAFVQYRDQRASQDPPPLDYEILFGEKEGRIAFANRRKDPLYLFAAMQRHLGYPKVPRPQKLDDTSDQLRQTLRRLEQLEARIQLMEEENRVGIDLNKFYQKPLDES